ncbi:hypothetical protein [Pseudomonas knackmussii]|uniref:hypothetical protein n=1 Tax=Pseudomonas knackmussii TaxID=65741 RepID=UPI003F4A6BB7
MTIEEQFSAHIRTCLEEARRLGYSGSIIQQMLDNHGAVGAAKRLIWLEPREARKSGFERMVEMRRMDLTVEQAMLDSRFSGLFGADELVIARWRLDNPNWTRNV